MMAAPSAFSHVLPSAWSKCQWVLIRCLIGSRLRLLAASRIRGRDAVIPASMKTLPSAPVSTAMFPPDPSRTLTSRRSLCTLIEALVASSRIKSTMLLALAKTSRGLKQRPPAAKAAERRQHRQKLRRETKRCCAMLTSSSPCATRLLKKSRLIALPHHGGLVHSQRDGSYPLQGYMRALTRDIGVCPKG